MKPTLGVLITYFNEKELLSRCLESLLNQIQKPDEIIIYDDASQFPADRYVSNSYPVQIIHSQKNQGPAWGRNILLDSSRSDYIHFHDCDDSFCKEWCQRVRQAIEQTGVDAVFTEVTTYRGSQVVSERVLDLKRLSPGEDLIKFLLQGALLTSASTMRRSSALAVGGYRQSLSQSEDFDFHIRLAASGITYTVIKEPMVLHELRETSHSSRNRKLVWASMIDSIRLLSDELDYKYRKDLAEAALRGGSKLFRLGARSEAKRAFKLADELGPPSFINQGRFYRYMAKIFGPEIAERLEMLYRNSVCEVFRRKLPK